MLVFNFNQVGHMKVILSLMIIVVTVDIIMHIRSTTYDKDTELGHWKYTCEMLTAVMQNSERVLRNNKLDVSADTIQRALLDAKKPV